MAIAPISPPPTGYTEGICATYTPVSEVFTFNVRTICNRAGVDQLQLMFKNRYGMYDYYTFTPRPINIVNTEFLRKIKGNRDIVNLELTYVYSNNISLMQ